MNDDFDPRLNDPMFLSHMPGKDIYGIPKGNLVNAIENAAERITELEARNIKLQAPDTIEFPATCTKCWHQGTLSFDTTGAEAEAMRRYNESVKTLFYDLMRWALTKRLIAAWALAFLAGLAIGWMLG